MKYEINVTKDDFIEFNMTFMKHNRYGRRNLMYVRLLMPTIAVICLVALIIMKTPVMQIAITGVLFVIVSAIWVKDSEKIMRKSLKINVDRLEKKGKKMYSTEGEIEFKDDEIDVEEDEVVSVIPYNQVLKLGLTDNNIFIHTDPMKAIIVPYRCLGKDKDRVLNFLRTKVKAVQDNRTTVA